MKLHNQLSKLFGILFVLSICASILISMFSGNTLPLSAASFSTAEAQTERFMEAFCSGDFSAAEDLLSGNSDITLEPTLTNSLSKVLWDAYLHSLTYTFHDGCYTDGYGLYRDVTVSYLDLPTLMTDLQTNSPFILANKAAKNGPDSYDTNGKYTQTFIMDTLAEAAEEILSAKDYTTTSTLTLQLASSAGRWQIRYTHQLMDLLHGNIGGG